MDVGTVRAMPTVRAMVQAVITGQAGDTANGRGMGTDTGMDTTASAARADRTAAP
jgi:hypothetical protein